MQQTENLKLNLIEGTDPVDWTVLNENAEKLEAAVVQTQSDLTSELGTGGKNARISFGSYIGTGKYGSNNKNTLTFDFTPVVVLIAASSSSSDTMIMLSGQSKVAGIGSTCQVSWSGKTVSWYNSESAGLQLNTSNLTLRYVAIGY